MGLAGAAALGSFELAGTASASHRALAALNLSDAEIAVPQGLPLQYRARLIKNARCRRRNVAGLWIFHDFARDDGPILGYGYSNFHASIIACVAFCAIECRVTLPRIAALR